MKQIKRGIRRIVLAVVLVAAAVWFASFFFIVRERGRRTQCFSNLSQIGLPLYLYAAEHNELNPTNITDLIKYIGGDDNVRMFMCPTGVKYCDGEMPKRLSEFRAAPQFVGYEYLSATSSVPDRKVSATIVPVMCDKAGNHGSDGINILFADGHPEWWSGTIEDYGRSNSLTITINTNWVK